MWARSYFPASFWARTYWPGGQQGDVVTVPVVISGTVVIAGDVDTILVSTDLDTILVSTDLDTILVQP